MTTVINILKSGRDYIHMIVRIDASGYAKTQKVEASETILACDRITVC